MSGITTRKEARLLTQGEYDLVAPSHAPKLAELEQGEAADLLRKLTAESRKYRDLSHRQRREARRKADPTNSRQATDHGNTERKRQIFVAAARRLKKHLGRLDARAHRERMVDSAHRALAMRQAAEQPSRPSSKTAGKGMKATPVKDATKGTFPAEGAKKGAVSAHTKRQQAKRDSR